MASEGYIPRQDDQFQTWHDNFKTALLANAATFGLVAGDTTPITADNTDIHAKIVSLTVAKAAQKAATDAKNLSRVGAEARARAIARRVKSHPAYTPTLGATLGIIGADSTVDLNTAKPDIKGRDMDNGHVEIQFKKSISDGVNIYSKRGTETVFTFLAHDSESPYIDTRPLLDPTKPEVRLYKAKYVNGDDEVGTFSDDLEVNCKPI
jgi:hypothetical protein